MACSSDPELTPSQPERRGELSDLASDYCVPCDGQVCAGLIEDKAISRAVEEQNVTREECCGSGSGKPQNQGCRVGSKASGCRAPDCCQDERRIDNACHDDESGPSTRKCAQGYCSASAPDGSICNTGLEEPDCCRGETSACCDDSCLDRLALRECELEPTTRCFSEAENSSCPAGTKRTACNRHQRSTRERYGATIEALGCICRALLALGQEPCCDTRKRSSVERKGCSRSSSTRSLLSPSTVTCCGSGIAARQPPGGNRVRFRKSYNPGCDETCCKTAKSVASADSCAHACCASGNPSSSIKPAAAPRRDICAGSCCDAGKPKTFQEPNTGVGIKVNDAENQAAGVEQVALCISGMTCTGCETKLNRTLALVSGVKNLKTSLVLSRAEFDVDLQLIAVGDIIKHLERTTEFKCERITDNGSSMDLVVPGDTSAFVNRAWPAGVTDICPVDKNVVRVSFEPTVVGARDLMTHWGREARLAPISGDPSLEAGSKHVRHVGYMTILSAIFTIPVLVMAWAPIPNREIAYSSASLILATVVQLVVAGPFYPKALKALIFSRVIEMDLLIVLSTSAAYIFSVISFGYLVAGKPLAAGQFFETSTLLVTLIMVGRYVAALARQKAVESISIRSLQTQSALLIDNANATAEQYIDARLLQYGDVFKVLPDTEIPTDGTVVTGSSEVDESLLTGESCPVEKHAKSQVIAGTINGSGTLVVRLTRLPGDNTINTIAAMVDEAKFSKPQIQELADKVASLFVPVVVTLAIVTFVIWVSAGIAVGGKSRSEATVQAITYAITVLIVSCPCAIGLAVPMVVVIASGVAAERGIVFKSADAIEVAYKASHVVLDKTGTLTQGKLTVAVEHCLGNGDSGLPLLLGLIADSRHPVSVAVANHLRSKGIVASALPGVKSLTGRGLQAEVAGQTLQAGNSRWLGLSSHAAIQPVLGEGFTAFCFTIDGELAAVYGLEDSIRASASHAVATLQSHGVSVHVVSGDDDGAVRSITAKLGIPADNTRARSSPADKQIYVKDLVGDASDAKKPVVIFCGDGTNDAVALAQATIGVHMNEGSDVARSAADVVLIRPDLSGILVMMNISKRSIRRIGFNFAWSFVYNTFAVLLAAGAFMPARIPPQLAGLGELVSVLPVIAAAVLLRWSQI